MGTQMTVLVEHDLKKSTRIHKKLQKSFKELESNHTTPFKNPHFEYFETEN